MELQSSALSVTAVVQYQPLQMLESSILLRDLLNSKESDQYRTHLVRFAMSTVFSISYGRRIKSTSDKAVLQNKEVDEYFISVNVPGKFIVESWPFLLYLPRFLQWFRYEPERRRARESAFYLSSMNSVKAQMELGSAPPSMATHALERREQFGLTDVELAYALSSPWAAGVGTTVSAIEVAILAMLHYPEVMRKAQAELDTVIGSGRLPGFEDQSSLPYMQALIKESTRWRPIVPTGVPHSVTQDDTYAGMFIPKGSTVYANNFVILADPDLFPDPDTFKPERFLDPNIKTHKMAFGYGRRVCPGMHIALQALYISLSRLLWAFDILPVSENGKEYIPPADDFTSGLVSRPANLKYRLVPRHEGVLDLITLDAEKADMDALAWQ
ncbi:hypothetical protein DXG01_016875 [Tephrocybe rancida]|nr:hypothetical protein DXG01_016875 [Tephrocybe rancida]